ncbi:MAG: hypothetical protein QF719_08405 [Chloroflexota bacterium]|jgi:hypothetical protein|nr:hypothetical protein [Chloroflexota bacterium]MDP6509246.1 hypothetical protein [Chloroflexota bacterium]MDP6758215.1 hypothetical protein [Chloroflexota bacterium]
MRVGHEDERALEDADQDGVESGDIAGDFGGEAADPAGQGALAEHDRKVVGEALGGVDGHGVRSGYGAESESSEFSERKKAAVQA